MAAAEGRFTREEAAAVAAAMAVKGWQVVCRFVSVIAHVHVCVCVCVSVCMCMCAYPHRVRRSSCLCALFGCPPQTVHNLAHPQLEF